MGPVGLRWAAYIECVGRSGHEIGGPSDERDDAHAAREAQELRTGRRFAVANALRFGTRLCTRALAPSRRRPRLCRLDKETGQQNTRHSHPQHTNT